MSCYFQKRGLLVLLLISFSFVLLAGAHAEDVTKAEMPPYLKAAIEDQYPEGLPRYLTAEEQEWLEELRRQGLPEPVPLGDQTPPPTGTVWTPGEYEPLAGVLVAWESYTDLLTDFCVQVSQSDTNAEVYVVVDSTSEQTSVTSTLTSAGANMSNVQFLVQTTDSVWIRDYGPRFFYEDSVHAIMDHTYNRPSRPNDDAFPSWLAGYWGDTLYDLGITHGGGNFHAFSDGDAFMSTLVLEENTGYTEGEIIQLFSDYLNVDLTIYDRLPSGVDATGHIDMWFLPLADNKVLVGEFDPGVPGYSETETAVADLLSRGYTVYRTPSYNSGSGGTGGTHYTYTNAAIVNHKVFVPEYGGTHAADDATAVAVFQQALPDHEIIQVDCSSIISAAGAIHCIIKHVYTENAPVPTAPTIVSTPVTTAYDGELYAYDVFATGYPGAMTYSLDTYPAGMTIDPDSGIIEWTPSSSGDFDVTVRASNGVTPDDTQYFIISVSAPPIPTVYDFYGITNPSGSHTAEDGEIDVADSMIENGTFPARRDSGINGWNNWAEAGTAEYTALVGSDDNRYQGDDPGTGDNAAMIFEFYIAEDPADIVQIDVAAEVGRNSSTDLGWAYIWNYSTGSYLVLGSQSGTADQVISASIDTDPDDYIDPGSGQLTVFVVNEDTSDFIQVDDISITVYTPAPTYTLDPSSTTGGSVTDPGEAGPYTYNAGAVVTLTAEAETGYHFVVWTGDTAGIADVYAADTTVTMNDNYAVVANFAIDTFTLDYTAGPGGSLTGDTSQVVEYGGDGTPVTAISDAGHLFVDWSDGSTDNPRTDTNVTANISVTANFISIGDTIDAAFSCVPSSGTLPFSTFITVVLTNLETTRPATRIAARIDVQTASGMNFNNWKAGWTTVAQGGNYSTSWNQPIPAIGSMLGDNVFTLKAEDVTPSPYNQPPYPSAGDTATAGCTVEGIAP